MFLMVTDYSKHEEQCTGFKQRCAFFFPLPRNSWDHCEHISAQVPEKYIHVSEMSRTARYLLSVDSQFNISGQISAV